MDAGSGRTRQRLVGVALLLLGLWFLSAVARPLWRPYAWSDFATFYSAATAFRADISPYDLTTLQETGRDDFEGWIGRYLYPPPFAATIVRPLASLPFAWARRIWVVFEALAYLSALLLLCRVVFSSVERRGLAITGLVGLSWTPFHLDLRLGSVSGILLLLLVVCLDGLRRRQDLRAGIALGAATLLKVSPALLVGLFVLRRRWRLAFTAVGSTVVLAAVSLGLTGWQAWSDYLLRVVPVLSTANFSWFTNQSLDALFWRLFVANPDTTPWVESALLYRLFSVSSGIAVLAAVAWMAWRRRTAAPQEMLSLAAVGLVAALLVARVSWEYMTVLAIPALLLWIRDVGAEPSWRRGVLPALAWILCAAPFPYTQEPLRSGAGILLESPRLAGLLLIFAAGIWRTAQRSPQP